MMSLQPQVNTENNQFELGRILGRHETLNIVAARCSAADAILLRDVREKKMYEGVTKDWEDCCVKLLHMSKASANRIIQHLEEFGPQYFEISQLTRISPATYRAIAPSIQDGKLLTEGEAIALVPENAEKVAAAVAAIRKEAKVVDVQVVKDQPAVEPVAPKDPFRTLQENFHRLVEEFTELARQTRDRGRLADALGACRLRLQMMEREL